jgi:hypothetical protein
MTDGTSGKAREPAGRTAAHGELTERVVTKRDSAVAAKSVKPLYTARARLPRWTPWKISGKGEKRHYAIIRLIGTGRN